MGGGRHLIQKNKTYTNTHTRINTNESPSEEGIEEVLSTITPFLSVSGGVLDHLQFFFVRGGEGSEG